jgi:hypothetical protein
MEMTLRRAEAYDADMVRHARIVVATAAATAGLLSGALAPAAGDERATGSKHSYTEDGIPYVDTGPQCRAGHSADKTADRGYDASDY